MRGEKGKKEKREKGYRPERSQRNIIQIYTGKVQGQVVAWNSRNRTEKKRSGNDKDRNGEEKGDG